MWIAKKLSENAFDGGSFSLGKVSISSKNCAVVTDGEVRDVEIMSTNGLCRIPKVGEEVLLFKGSEGEKIIIGNVSDNNFDELSSGEICLRNGLSSLRLFEDGRILIEGISIVLDGSVTINGTTLA